MVGAVDEYSQPSREERLQIQVGMGWEKSASDYYKLAGYDLLTPTVLNTGVMILSPKMHGKFLADVYKANKTTALTHPRGFHFEQSSIGYALQKAEMFEKLDNRFNAIYPIHLISQNRSKSLRDYFNENYFTHFAGNSFLDAAEQIRHISGG